MSSCQVMLLGRPVVLVCKPIFQTTKQQSMRSLKQEFWFHSNPACTKRLHPDEAVKSRKFDASIFSFFKYKLIYS